jgi:sugar phosphate isomerase/epimerase
MRAGVIDAVLGDGGDLETFERARSLGFAGVEIFTLDRGELRSPASERLAALREACDATSLEIPAFAFDDHNNGGIADADPWLAGEASDDVRVAIAWAAELGVDALLIPFFSRAELRDRADVDRAATAFRSLCPLAAEAGVTLCYEGTLPAAGIRELAARVDSPAFGCYFDLANPLRRGLDTATEIRALGELIRRVHFKDARVTSGDCPPGLGRVDFAESARALAEVGYDGWLVLETPAGPPEVVGRDLAFAHTVFPALEPALGWPRFGAFSYELSAGAWQRLGEAFQQLGLQAVQLGGELLDACVANPDEIEQGRAALAEHGVSITSLAGYRNLVAPDERKRRGNVERIERCLELAPRFGTWVVATETGSRHPEGDWTDSPENWGETAWTLLDDALERLLPVAERCGTVLALEASVKNVLRTPGQLLGLLERYPSRHLQVVCDPYNYLSSHLMPAQARFTRDFLDRFEHRFVIAHLKDVDRAGAEAGTPELGTGAFDQRPYLEFLRDRRRDLPLILEHLPLDHVPQAVRKVREALGLEVTAATLPA